MALAPRRTVLAGVLLLSMAVLAGATVPALAQPAAAPEKPGRWAFKQPDRPIKAVIVGGSVSAWSRGNYGQYLGAACPRVEIVNRAKARLGAKALRRRFKMQVLRNRRVDVSEHEAVWLIFNGGLNSIGDPLGTNRAVAATLRAATEAGLKTIGLTVGPWGSEGDKRWRGARGLEYREDTQRSVDFLLSRLSPREAFGPSRDAYEPGDLPDIGVDLYDSALRDAEAELRDAERIANQVRRSQFVKKRLKGLDEAARDSALQTWVERAAAIPRWFMAARYQAFDHIHPNEDGHRVIAQTVCPKLPASWSCDCPAIAQMAYSRPARGVVVPSD